MKSHLRLLLFVFFYLAVVLPLPLLAQASLSAENKIDELTVEIDGRKEVFTVIRDYYQEDQWYYIPDRPRLAMAGKLPQFHLIKYQTKDPKNSQKLLTGGVLQFAIKMSLPAKAVEKLKEEIVKSLRIRFPKVQKFLGNYATNIKLSAIPFNSSMVTLYDLEKGVMLTDAPQKPGIAPTFATQEIPFQLNLTDLGADISEALTRKGGGIPVLVTFNYYAITPPCGFKIEVNWDMVYRHFSADFNARCRLKYLSYLAGDFAAQAQLVKDLINTNKAIKVTVLSGEAFKDEDIDKFMLPVLLRINNEIFDNTRPPPLVDPAKVAEEPPSNWFSKLFESQPMEDYKSQVALKAVEYRNKGHETFEMTRQLELERVSCCGGLIGIGDLSEDEQNQLIELIPAGNWQSAYFSLPAVGDDPSLGIKSVDLSVTLVDKDGKTLSGGPAVQSATWSEKTGQWAAKGETRTALLFPLAYLYDKYPRKVADFKFKVVSKITHKHGRFEFTSLEPVFDGEKAISNSLDCVDVLKIYGRDLGFARDEPAGILTMVDVTAKTKKPSQTLSGQLLGDADEENPLLFLVGKSSMDEENPIELKINFQTNDGKTIPWAYNSNKDIRTIRPSLTFFINRHDWEKQ